MYKHEKITSVIFCTAKDLSTCRFQLPNFLPGFSQSLPVPITHLGGERHYQESIPLHPRTKLTTLKRAQSQNARKGFQHAARKEVQRDLSGHCISHYRPSTDSPKNSLKIQYPFKRNQLYVMIISTAKFHSKPNKRLEQFNTKFW